MSHDDDISRLVALKRTLLDAIYRSMASNTVVPISIRALTRSELEHCVNGMLLQKEAPCTSSSTTVVTVVTSLSAAQK